MKLRQFGYYRPLRLLARGRSEVYEAEDTTTGRRVALQLFPQPNAQDPNLIRLQREAAVFARLLEPMADPHVVLFQHVGAIDGRPYAQMPLIDAVDLRAVLAAGPLTPERAVAIIGNAAAALDTVHAAGLMHRAIAPKKFLVADDDSVYLLGLQSMTYWTDHMSGPMTQRFAYSAPEQFTSADTTDRADCYSLACVLYECLTGAQPFAGESVEHVVSGHMLQEPPAPSEVNASVPITFDDVIARGMAKKPEERYASAGDLAAAAGDALRAAT